MQVFEGRATSLIVAAIALTAGAFACAGSRRLHRDLLCPHAGQLHPASVNTAVVEIDTDSAAEMTVTNDFTDVKSETVVIRRRAPLAPAAAPAAFTAAPVFTRGRSPWNSR
jgi:hypothetical protein